MVARGGIEPPTRGFSVRLAIFNYFNNQSLAALANPHSSHFQAQFGHTQSSFGTGPLEESGLIRNLCLASAALPQGFSATIFPFFHTWTGVPYMRAVLRAPFAARRKACPTPVAKSLGRAAFARASLAGHEFFIDIWA